MVPRAADRAARRETILTAAVRVFARRGFAAARIEDVAREAGVAKGSVYLYFDSREELLRAAFEGLAARSAQVLEEAAAGEAPAARRLAAMVRAVLALLARERELALVLLDVWSADRAAGPQPLDLAAFYREYRAAVAALLAEAARDGAALPVDPERHAAVLVGAIEGCLLQWLVDPSVELTGLTEPLLRLLVPGDGAPA
ncbi:TetR/AcrR family transcriptional regulator [Streptomyces aidingensis]|uniref:TetR/AcrR family transcriptional regulator, fatty acid metabolism regulator protein n=1 Tax=Streptomyces aidingensis TaxID=910347 RepID=A0A1I1SSG9_9ACTN|nr:TetR/AcrR family transcriptional regulator [Streptomyces aidingensis]SFD46853.1 TetR/AcrR family transcriptional regulator, fatty acid metabolism regulator protein [Streptomyces aidingensis]